MKYFQYLLKGDLLKRAMNPIRTKMDVIMLLLQTLKYIGIEDASAILPSNQEKIVLFVDKTSRLIYFLQDKIFTYQFPFVIKVETEHSKPFYRFTNYDYEINNMISSLLLSVFNKEEFFAGSFDDINLRLLEEIVENDWPLDDTNQICDVIKKLLIFEPGYLRYDHDLDRINGRVHPEHHIDVFYSNSTQIKLGVCKEINEKWFIELLSANLECKYINY